MREKNSNEAVESSAVCYDTLEQWARGKIQAQLQHLLEEEVTTFLGRARHERRGTVSPIDPPTGSRNGYGKPRAFSMLSGTVTVRRPRVRDLTERFESKVLPLFTRRTQEVGTLLPELYLHGLSTGDFDLALRGLLGEGAPLSASSIQRLKARFELDYEAWKKRDLAVVYWWADGLYVKAGIEDRKSALLTIVGALTTGEKIVLACESGERESKESWFMILRNLKHRGLTFPQLTVADGHLGIWAAFGEIHSTEEEPRCWNLKITNVLNDLPKKAQQKAAELLKAMPYAETNADCERRRDAFVRTDHKTDKKAVETLLRDWDRMVTFYAFRREH
ncbi:MAG: Mobile element protein [Nitrospira sp.]|jgi:transposase-like protein|nr:Mobile element protein [Nitrospira sp.]